MKKVLFFFGVCLLSFSTVAQKPTQFLGTSGNRIEIRGQTKMDSLAFLPRYIDSPALDAYSDTLGAVFLRVTNMTIYYRDSNLVAGGHKWTALQQLLRIGTINSQTKSPKGAVIIGDSLNFQTVDDTHVGMLPFVDWLNFQQTYRYFKNTDSTKRDYFSFFAGNRTLTGLDNFGFGESSSTSFTSGTHNIGLGYFTNNEATTASGRIGIGYLSNQVGNASNVIAIGSQALRNNSQDDMLAIGTNALLSNTTGQFNIAIGNLVLQNSNTASFNVGVGYGAMQNTTTGDRNTATGVLSMNRLTTGHDNTANGFGTNSGNTTAQGNTAVGSFAMDFNTIGDFNSVLGARAMGQDSSGFANTVMGYEALDGSFADTLCTIVGFRNLQGPFPAPGNGSRGSYKLISIGDSTGQWFTSSTHWRNCILIGSEIKVSSENDTLRQNFIAIGNKILSDTNNIAIFGQADQHIRLGNGGGNTAAMNGIASTASDLFYNTDFSTYMMYDGGDFKPIIHPHTAFTPITGGTVNLLVNQYTIIKPAGTLATLTINFPSSPHNNDMVEIKLTQAITSVTWGNGTVENPPTSGVTGYLKFVWDASLGSWY